MYPPDKETRSNAQGTRTTWNVHPDNQGGLGFESESTGSSVNLNRHYIAAGGQTLVIVTRQALAVYAASTATAPGTSPGNAVKVEYWHKDHLGSLVATTDHTGTVTARYAYDPFGKRRQTNGTYDSFGTLKIEWVDGSNKGTDRGWTGHEHLDDIGIVHMNGRLFDPLTGRFLQADPMNQDPFNLQNYNRYSYCYNNPLICTDPTGLSFWTDIRQAVVRIGAAVLDFYGCGGYCSAAVGAHYGAQNGGGLKGAIIGGVSAYLAFQLSPAGTMSVGGGYPQAALSGFFAGVSATGNLKGGIQGAFTAAVFFGAGELIGGAYTDGGKLTYGEGIMVHGVAGCVTSVVGGGKCGPGALSAAFSKAAGPWTSKMDAPAGLLVSAMIGGTTSALGGGKFANGAATAAFGYLFNYLSHKARARLIGAGAFLGGTAGAVAAGGCTAGTGGVCALGAPTLVAGGMAAGAVTGEAIANAWDQLDNLLSKATNAGPQAGQYALVAERAGLYPTVGGDLVQMNAGDVWKYGISTDPAGRYPAQALSVLGLRMDIQSTGTLPQVYAAEKIQLINYAVSNGALPPGNRIFK